MDVLCLTELRILRKILKEEGPVLKHITLLSLTIVIATMAVLFFTGCNDAAAPPTQLTDFRVVARHNAESFVPDGFNIARLPEGVEVYFWAGGQAYELGTRGGFGGIDGDAIKGSFWTIEGEGGKYLPVTIPFTQGESYRLYHPANGEYIVTAAFLYEGQAVTTAPLHFTVGAYTLPQ